MVQLISPTSDTAALLGVKGGGIIFERTVKFWIVRGVKNFCFAFVEQCSGRHQDIV